MELSLTDDEVAALRATLDEVISDMSPEIAQTDNWQYRHILQAHRAALQSVRTQLEVSLQR